MSDLPHCPICKSEYSYIDGLLYICPECAHEWPINKEANAEEYKTVKDSNGNILNDGDTITVIKDLKVKGSSSVVKVGTKIKNIRLVDGDHEIDCKVDGVGAIKVRAKFAKKV